MEEEKLTLGKKLQKLRKENKLSQVKLGEIINASDRTISKWENDKSTPDIMYLNQLCKLYKVSLDYLFDGKVTFNVLAKEYLKAFGRFIKEHIITVIFAIVFIFLLTFYINNKNSTIIYKIKCDENNIVLDNGYYIESKGKNILMISNIQILDADYEALTTKLRLYTIVNGEKVFFYENDALGDINIEEPYGYDEIFSKERKKAMKKGIHILVEVMDTKNETHIYDAALGLVDRFSNNKLFYLKKSKPKIDTRANEPEELSEIILDTELDEIKLLNNGFTKDENTGMYMKDYKDVNVVINLEKSTITIYKKEKSKMSSYKIDMIKNSFDVIIKSEEKGLISKYEYHYQKDELQCSEGNCENYLKDFEFILDVLSKIK